MYDPVRCFCGWAPPPYVDLMSTSRPPDITHMMNETRPSPFFAVFHFVYYTECKLKGKNGGGLGMRLKDYSCCPLIGLAYEPLLYCSSGCKIWLAMRYKRLLSDLSASRFFFFSKDRCLNRCNISFAKSRVEDCLELNFKDAGYQTLAHLSYSSCVCLTSVHATRT